MNEYHKVNWSPFATNVLDAGDYDLCTPDGEPVKFWRDGMGRFYLLIGDERWDTDNNLQMSYWMNQKEIGGTKRRKE